MIQIEYLPIVLTGLGLTASIVYYANVLSNANRTQQQQLDTRQAQLFMNIYNRWDSEMAKAFYEIMNWEWNDFDDFMDKYGWLKNPELYGNTVSKLTIYYEGIGVLVKEGLVDIRLIALLIAGVTKGYWEKIGLIVIEGRERLDAPYFMSETEYLYNELVKYLDANPNLHG